MDAYILFSGGIDSSALIPYYKEFDYNINLIFIDYGQISNDFEYSSVKKISSYYNLDYTRIKLNVNRDLSGLILGRNSFLIYTTILHEQIDRGIISLGIHSGTSYKDCSPEFISTFKESLIAQGLDQLKIDTPFLTMNKLEVWEFAKFKNVPLDLTYSCEMGLKQPCSQCSSCKDLIILHET